MFLFNLQLIELQKFYLKIFLKKKKIEKLKKIAKDTVDIKGIGFYTLGSARKNLNDNKKKNIQNYLNNIF